MNIMYIILKTQYNFHHICRYTNFPMWKAARQPNRQGNGWMLRLAGSGDGLLLAVLVSWRSNNMTTALCL